MGKIKTVLGISVHWIIEPQHSKSRKQLQKKWRLKNIKSNLVCISCFPSEIGLRGNLHTGFQTCGDKKRKANNEVIESRRNRQIYKACKEKKQNYVPITKPLQIQIFSNDCEAPPYVEYIQSSNKYC